ATLLMKRSATQILFFSAMFFIALSISLATVSLYTIPDKGSIHTSVLANDNFQLTPNETYRQGLGSFYGGENITLEVQSSPSLQKNFSLMLPLSNDVLLIKTGISYNTTQPNFTYSFIASPDYYDAVFTSASHSSGTVHFQAVEQKPAVIYPYSWLNEASEILFIASLSAALIITSKTVLPQLSQAESKANVIPSLSKKARRWLLAVLLLGVVVWLLILAINSGPLGTLENWYTDNARDTYVASLFLKDGFSVFSQPLSKLASLDVSNYKYVTWPQMPHLYPLGSVLLFLPFGILLQNGFNSTMLFKIEIAIFLVFATVSVYFFLKVFLKKDMAMILKLLGIYIIYVTLVAYAADGMFESVAFLFALFAVYMFITERYDYFFLLITVSTFFKYEAAIFLFPLIVIGLIKLVQKNKLPNLLKNKAVGAGLILGIISIFTAYLSAPYLVSGGPQLIMNGINAFSSNTHIAWVDQSFFVLLTLGVTASYAIYMLNKNVLLSLSALFLLLPSFLMPYIQNWYFPFIFVYALIPQQRKELNITVLWLGFMIGVLAYSGTNFQLLIQYFH
ncbi:MAG TPA: hypothetical protein VJY36_02300, partial [Candidatus Bathyarchaeia archaeon]|nr:hypothetical protein [Candidatus Bathyarchaeia archaeon]